LFYGRAVSDPKDDFVRAWDAFREAFERRDRHAALRSLQSWIGAWDECFWRSELEVFAHAYSPDVVVVAHLPFPGMRDYRGLDGFRKIREDVSDTVSNFRFEVTALEWSDRRFLGLGRIRARGRLSGLLLRLPLAVLWSYEGGKISRIEAFVSHRRGRAALRGRAEPSGDADEERPYIAT
jgi:hypothetical protein